jgi:FimV-like protein
LSNTIPALVLVTTLLLPVSASADSSADAESAVRQAASPEQDRLPETEIQETGKVMARLPGAGEYGPTQESVTLWAIAKQLGHEQGVSAQKMLNALHKANPAAFVNDDINSLVVGVMLKVPEIGAKSGYQPSLKQPPISPVSVSLKPEMVCPPQESVSSANSDSERMHMEKLEQELGSLQQLLTSKDQKLAQVLAATTETEQDDAVENGLFAFAGLLAGMISVLGWLYWRNRQLNISDDDQGYTRKVIHVRQKTTDFIPPPERVNSSGEAIDEFDYHFDFAQQIPGMEDDDYDPNLDDEEDESGIESKIDLAKAYMDMGDVGAAKAALTDVLQKGSTQQKVTAQALLNALA